MEPGTGAADRGTTKTEKSGGVPKCARCGADMEEGHLLESGLGALGVMRWIAGAPARSSVLGVLRVPREKQRKVSSFRCSKCGYLESYAL